MNLTEDQAKENDYFLHFNTNEMFLKLTFGNLESLFSFDTYQFKDYSKVVVDYFDHDTKLKRRKEVFPRDCEKAFNMGGETCSKMIKKILTNLFGVLKR